MNRIEDRLNRIELLLSLNKPILTIDEFSAYSGISVSQIYKLTSARKIPHSKPTGKAIFFDKQKVTEWLLQNPVKLSSEIDGEATSYVSNNPKSV